ncbi:hypothetical protein VHUM_00002 [Vanrija humicola]|uniref:cellulase n=1 Tax=Vanrija humicola TaxID=5417 RepID=A0A7D8Z3G1_VANHU|nr:hypothetical protein VHUM_00002 [Vanrija humicola]
MLSLAVVGALVALAPLSAAQVKPSGPVWMPPPATEGLVAAAAGSSGPNKQWTNALGNSLYFYDAQRSGNLSLGTYGNRVSWRNTTLLGDGSDWGLDLSGGFHDAGDYIKCTYPFGFTMFALSWGALSFGPGFDLSNQTAYMDGTLRWGFDWLIKAHPSNDTLFVQVGNTTLDNDYWGGDLNIPLPRPAFPVNRTHPGTDVWTSTAAAFAMGAMAYDGGLWNTSAAALAPTSLQDANYSATLLNHAKTLYDVANTTTKATFSDSVPEIGDAYVSTGWNDTLAVAALSLAAATNDSAYYADAYNTYVKYNMTAYRGAWCWEGRTPALYVLFAEIATARPNLAAGAGLANNLTGWQTEAEAYFDYIVAGNNGGTTPAGLVYYSPYSDNNTLQPVIALIHLMLRYAPLASSANKTATYRAFADTQIDYILGKNPMNRPYMVGLHPNSPKNPQTAPASGGDNVLDVRNDPPTEPYIIYGAIPGGPLKSDEFWDYRDDWVQSEPALDYSSSFPAIAAYKIATGASDPYYVKLAADTAVIPSDQPCDNALPCDAPKKKKLSGGAIAGIVVGSVVGVALIGALAWLVARRRRSSNPAATK